jgi:hypothetical protein
MHGLPRNEIANVIDHGYSVEAIEEARRLLIQTYYQAGFAKYCGDCEHSSSMTETTVYVNNYPIKWVVTVYLDLAMPEEGACVIEYDNDGNSQVIIDLSHVEMRHLWEKSRH